MSSPHQSVPPSESSHTAPEGSDTGQAAAVTPVKVIRTPRLAFLGVVVLLFGVFFFFVGAPALLWWLLVLPVAAAVWVLRTQTTVTAEGLDLRTVRRSRHIGWDRVKGLRIPKRGFVKLHLDDDSEVTLPAVSYDRLRELIVASNGRIPDLFTAAEDAEQREWEAKQAAREAADGDTAAAADSAEGGETREASEASEAAETSGSSASETKDTEKP